MGQLRSAASLTRMMVQSADLYARLKSETDYDPSQMQDHLFIAPSFEFLRRELEALVQRLGISTED